MALTDNLNAYYKFDESSGDAADALGVNTLTNNNSTAYGAGIINNGADLERLTPNYFSHTDAAAFDFSGDMSLSVWLKVEGAPAAGEQMIIIGKDANGADNTRSYTFGYNNSGGTKMFAATLFPTGYSYPSYWSATKDYDLGTGTFHHVVITISIAAANNSKGILYIDGASQGNFTLIDGTGATSIQNSASDFQVGYESFQGAFDGIMDELGLWSRTLTSGEVTTLYNSGAGLQYPFTTPPAAGSSLGLLLGVGN